MNVFKISRIENVTIYPYEVNVPKSWGLNQIIAKSLPFLNHLSLVHQQVYAESIFTLILQMGK